MRTSLFPLVLLVLVPLTVTMLGGCSAKGDLEKICNAEQLAGTAGIKAPDERSAKTSAWLADNLRSSEGKNVMKALAYVAGDQRGNILRKAAEEVGYTGPCPMADAMTK